MVKVDIYFSSQIKRTMLTHHRKENQKVSPSLYIFTDLAVGLYFSEWITAVYEEDWNALKKSKPPSVHLSACPSSPPHNSIIVLLCVRSDSASGLAWSQICAIFPTHMVIVTLGVVKTAQQTRDQASSERLWRLVNGGRLIAMTGMESMEGLFDIVPFIPFRPLQ